MNTRGLKKKPATSPLKPNNNKPKAKSKSKSKQKQKSKKFSAKDFLQALIDLQNTNCSTNKKRRNTTRDISSALTIATPALEKTVSASKIRSRSSFSQYRKKCNNKKNEPLTINLCAVITEEENVQYTEKTARSSYQQQQNKKLTVQIQTYTRRVNENLCAIKIQRAWRNYQTYKMVHNAYLREKRNRQYRKSSHQVSNYGNTIPKLNINSNFVHIKIRKQDKQNTLKIKKQNSVKKQERKQQQLEITRKIIQQRYNKSNEDEKLFQKSPIQYFENRSQQSYFQLKNSQNSQQLELRAIAQMKQNQAKRLNEIINLIQKGSKNKNKQVLINQLINKLQTNKRDLESDLSKQLEQPQNKGIQLDLSRNFLHPSLCSQQQFSSGQVQKNTRSPIRNQKQQSSNLLSSPQYSKQESIDNMFKKNELKSVLSLQKSQKSNQQIMSLKSLPQSHSSSSLFFDYQNVSEQVQELKIFDQRLKFIKQQKYRRLQKIDNELQKDKISNMEALQKKEKVYNKYQKQKKQIEKNKKQYIFSIAKLKKSAIRCQKQALKQSSSQSKIRKSFSSGNTVLKQVIQDFKLIQLYGFQEQQQPQLIQYIFRRQDKQNQILKQQKGEVKPLTNTPVLQLPSPNKNTESEQQLLQKYNNTQVLKQYSEQIQQLIQKQLIQEFVISTYMDENIFQNFKPYVQEIYQFKKIPDTQIFQYVSKIKPFFPEEGVMMLRVNQKINPTSLQILRIIRDLEYQADEYQLIIPEQCFKKYRATIQKKYQQLNNVKGPTFEQIKQKVKNVQIAQRVMKLQQQKRQKYKKYRNFQRDLKIMYMKSVFNCINQYLIQIKSSNVFMNGRSSIGPGQLSLAMKQYNQPYSREQYWKLLRQVQTKLHNTINIKCSIPSFKNYHDIELFQKQVMKQIQIDSTQNQFKWVNYMDQVLEIWQDLCTSIIDLLFQESCQQFNSIFNTFQ